MDEEFEDKQIWRSGTTIVQAIFDNWSRDIPLKQTQNEVYDQFIISVPILVLKELYRLYDNVMDINMRSRG